MIQVSNPLLAETQKMTVESHPSRTEEKEASHENSAQTTVKNKQGKRLLGFGRYAGIIGAYNAFLTYGLKSEKYNLKSIKLNYLGEPLMHKDVFWQVEYAKKNDVIIFVSGRKSSNGKMLYKSCKNENQNSYFISDIDELNADWFIGISSVGICGATSTPRWLMERVEKAIVKIA